MLPILALSATECPPYALAKGADFSVQYFDTSSKARRCVVKGDTLAGTPLEIAACNESILVAKVPDGWEGGGCFDYPQKLLRIFREEFDTLQTLGEAKPREKGCPPPPEAEMDIMAYGAEKVAVDPFTTASIRSVMTVLESDAAIAHGFKDIGKLDLYHSCLLEGKESQQENYVKKYRFVIEKAAENFSVPMALLTCSCGRESMFDHKAKSPTQVRGICQNVGASLKDVNRWITTKGSDLEAQWERYLEDLGPSLPASCRNQKLTQDLVIECPALGLGAAAVYYKWLYQRAMNGDSIGGAKFEEKSMDALVALAAVNNVGPKYTNALAGKPQLDWANSLVTSACEHIGFGKAEEVWAHMLSMHSCLDDESWLNHQGQPLRGECDALNTPAKVKAQLARRAEFQGRMPSKCRGKAFDLHN